MTRNILTVFAVALGLLLPTAAWTAQSAVVLRVEGMIDPGTERYIVEGIEQAEERGAQFILIELNTPGGMLDSTRTIVQALLNSTIPTIVYVSPSGAHAGSAGMFITMAAHIAAMAPGTNIGAATPISGQGKDIKEEGGSDLENKVKQDTLAFVRSIGKARSRNIAWAESAITEAASVTADEALKLNVVDFVTPSRTSLLEQLHGREVTGVAGDKLSIQTAGVTLTEVDLSTRQKFVHLLANPNVAYLLMMIGMVGLYFELSNPGAIFPGVAGAIALLLAFVSLNVLPFNTAGLLLIGLALILFVLELLLPTFGVLAVGGVISFFAGSLLLFDTPDATVGLSLSMIISVTLTLAALIGTATWLVVQTHRQRPRLGGEGLLGGRAEVLTELNPEGTVFAHGEIWKATRLPGADMSPIPKGAWVRVERLDGLTLFVTRIEEGQSHV